MNYLYMDIPNLSKYLVYEDGSLYAKNRGMMLYGSKNRQGEVFYHLSFDNKINDFFKINKSTLVKMYQEELMRRNCRIII